MLQAPAHSWKMASTAAFVVLTGLALVATLGARPAVQPLTDPAVCHRAGTALRACTPSLHSQLHAIPCAGHTSCCYKRPKRGQPTAPWSDVACVRAAPCSAQPFFKPTGTPGAYGTIDEVPPKWDLPSAMMKPTSTPGAYGTVVEDPPKWELPTWNFTMPTKAPKVMLPKLNMLPGLTFNGTGKHKVNLNATMLLNNLTQCATRPAFKCLLRPGLLALRPGHV